MQSNKESPYVAVHVYCSNYHNPKATRSFFGNGFFSCLERKAKNVIKKNYFFQKKVYNLFQFTLLFSSVHRRSKKNICLSNRNFLLKNEYLLCKFFQHNLIWLILTQKIVSFEFKSVAHFLKKRNFLGMQSKECLPNLCSSEKNCKETNNENSSQVNFLLKLKNS